VSPENTIAFENVSRFYGEVLGVNRVNLTVPPGVTSLVGPNGSGKTTLMNLMTGLLRPTDGQIRVLGISPQDPERLCRLVGYCTQFDAFPKGLTGYKFLYAFLRMHGMSHAECDQRAKSSLEIVGLSESANRLVGAYSKGMRQRVKLAQAIAHDPQVVILDEPLNGLDPMARAEATSCTRWTRSPTR
jgi:ABC-2 type transport system ATP-binding protein